MTLHTLLAASTATTVATKSKSSGSSYGFIIIIVVFAAFYFLVLRPRSQRQRQARTQGAAALEIGAAVMSVGGIKGVVVGMDDTDVQVEVSPGVVLTFIRKAVNAQAAPVGAGDEPTGVFHEDDDDFGRGDAGHADGEPEDGVEGGRGPMGYEGPDDRPGTGTEGR